MPSILPQFVLLTLHLEVTWVYIANSEGKKEPCEVFVDQVTHQVNYGKAQGESAKNLNQLMTRITQGAEQAHSETRNILSALGKLDPSTL